VKPTERARLDHETHLFLMHRPAPRRNAKGSPSDGEGAGRLRRRDGDRLSELPERSRRGGSGASRRRRVPRPQDEWVARSRYTAELLAAQDEERRRIARELHDGAASTLVGLSLDLTRLVESLAPGDGRELAAGCAALCEQSLRELRAAAFLLHPPLLERQGLAVALQWLADGFSKRSGIHVTFDAGTAAAERLRPPVELTLYRIAQEALTNVLRHSASPTARVALTVTAARASLVVTDAGKGSADAPPGRVTRAGVGLASMRERVRGLGGSLRLAFRPTGTVLTAVVPRT
jgi:signal transduction histidine kinase